MTQSGGVPVVLVVDDEPSIGTVMERIIRDAGARSVLATTLAEARTCAENYDFDLAVVDKNLSDGSGIALLREFRETHPDVPVIILTGYGNLDSAVEALRLGAVDYVLKPFNLESLSRRIKGLLQGRHLEAENQRLERMLQHGDRLSSLGTLAAGIAHEVNNPLAFVSSNLEFAAESLEALDAARGSPESFAAALGELRQALAESRAGLTRVTSIVREMKILARSDTSMHAQVSPARSVDVALTLAAPSLGKAIKVVREISPTPDVQAVEAHLTQVLLNLLINAAHAMPADRKNGHQITVRLQDLGEHVELRVSDNGSGIPQAIQPRIFDPFFTTKPAGQGTGLGLAICLRTITAMRGTLHFESEVGVGTTFVITLPVHSETESSPSGLTRVP